jgi:hypothetical protein
VLTATRPLRSGARKSPPGGGQGAASDSPERVLKRAPRILLFVNKKKQKNFIRLVRMGPHQTGKSFLVLFFKKEPLTF